MLAVVMVFLLTAAMTLAGLLELQRYRRRQSERVLHQGIISSSPYPAEEGVAFYGDGGTIHNDPVLDIETHNGDVVAVWFRCQHLPFEQLVVSKSRAEQMQSAYINSPGPLICGLVLKRKADENS